MVENSVRTVIGTACAYEAFALSTRRTPTLSKMCRHSKSFELVLFGTLLLHFHVERQIADRLHIGLKEVVLER